MRDPARIRPLLDRLAAIWESHPDLRLGQLLQGGFARDYDLFYTEDDKLISTLESIYHTPPRATSAAQLYSSEDSKQHV